MRMALVVFVKTYREFAGVRCYNHHEDYINFNINSITDSIV